MKASIPILIRLGVLIFLMSALFTLTYSQTILWSDDFASAADGATSGSGWEVLSSDGCDPEASVFAVQGAAFVINDMEGTGCTGNEGGNNDNIMRIGPINVSGASCLEVRFLVDAFAATGFEAGGPGGDLLKITTIVDGGIYDSKLFQGTGAITNVGPSIISIPFSANTVSILIEGGTQSKDEFFWISDIYISDISFTPPIEDFSACKDEFFDLNQLTPTIPGVWSGPGVNANQWGTFNLEAGETYELTFDPVDPCGSSVVVNATVTGGSPAGSRTLASCSTSNTAVFDLTRADDAIRNGTNSTVFWFTDPNKQLQHLISNPTAYTARDGDVVYGAYEEPGPCLSAAGEVTLRIQEPAPPNPVDDVEACVSYTLPALEGGLSYDGYVAGDVLTSDEIITISTGSGACVASTNYQVTILPAPELNPYTGVTEACDSLLLPVISGSNLSGNQAYFTGSDGSGTRYAAGSYYQTTGINTLYRYDGSGICSDEDSIQVDLGESAVLNLRDTIVCDTFVFPAYSGPGTFQGYYTERKGGGTAYQPGEGTGGDPGTVRFYARAGTENCIVEDSFDITFRLAPNLVTISGFQDCDTFRLPAIGGDNLSGNEGYFTMPGGQGTLIPAGTLLDQTTTLYVYDRIGSCPDELLLPVTIIQRPQLESVRDTVVCDTLVLPEIAGSLLTGAQGYWTEPFGVGSVYDPGGILTTSQKLYVYDERAGCMAQDSFEVTVNTRPRISAPIGERYLCDTFSLPPIMGSPLLGNEVMTTLPHGQGDTLFAGTLFADSSIIYLYGGVEGCRAEDSLRLYINLQPVITAQPDVDTCDYWVLPSIRGENLTANVAYYDAPEGLGKGYFPGDTLFDSGTYYSYDFTGIGCVAEDTFEVQLGLTPQLAHLPDTLACGGFTLPPIAGQDLQFPAYLNDPFVPTQFFTEGQLLTGEQQIFIYDADGSCVDTTSFSVRVLPQVLLEVPWRDTMVCDAFRLEGISGQALSGNEAYFDLPGGRGNRYEPGELIRDSIRLYVFDGRETCTDQDTLDIDVAPTPILAPIPDVFVCDFYVLPGLSGQNLTPAAAYFDGNTGARLLPGDTIFRNRRLEAVDSNVFACRSVQPFRVVVTPTPQLASVFDQERCDSLILPEMGGQFLPASASYFTDTLGSGFRLNPGARLEVSQKVYLYADTLGCRDEASFVLSVNYTPRVRNAMTDTTACFSIEVPELMGRDLSANTGYYDQPEGAGTRIELPLSIQSDTTLYLFGNNAACYIRDTVDVAVNKLAMDIRITDSIACFGQTGRIELQNISAKQPVDIRWSDPAFAGNTRLNEVPAGTYAVTLIDPDNCSLDKDITLSQPNALVLDCAIAQQVTVPNGRNGRIDISLEGGTAPYTLLLSGDLTDTLRFLASADLVVDTLPAGTYIFGLTDSLGCTQSCTQTITAPPCELAVELQAADISCSGAEDGSIKVQVSNAQAPLQIDWSDDQFTGQLNLAGLSAGRYAVTVTDIHACQNSAAGTIMDPAPLSLTASLLQPVTSNTANDGQVGIVFSGGTAPYQLVYDGPRTDTVNLASPASLEVERLRQGVYTFAVIDANNCRSSASLTVTNPNCGMSVRFAKADQQCPNTTDGALTTLVSGGRGPYQFIWEDGNRDSIRSNLPAGIYRLSVLDSEHCVSEVYDTIGIAHPLPALALQGDIIRCDSVCQSFELALSGTGPFNFFWSLTRTQAGQNSTLSGIVSGTTAATEVLTFCESGERLRLQVNSLEDAHCRLALDTSFTLSILPVPVLLVADTLCQEESLTIEGQVFDRSNPSDTITLANQAANGCDSLVYVNLTFLPTVYDTLRETICQEDSLLINGTSYHVANATGTETFAGQSAIGCDSILYVDLSFHPVDTNDIRVTLCEQDSLEVGGRIFKPANPSGLVRLPNAAATGCDSLIAVELNFVPQFTTELAQVICPEDSLMVNGTRYDRFRLSGTEVFSTAAGCDSVVTIDLSLLPVDTQVIRQSLCPGDSLLVNGIVYDGNNLGGLQRLEGASANGCDSLIEVEITYFPEVRTAYQDTLCYLDSLEVNGTLYHNSRPTGVEVFVGQGRNTCDSIVEVELVFREPVMADLAGTQAICAGTEAVLALQLSGTERYDVFYQAGNAAPALLSGLTDGATIPVEPAQTTVYQLTAVRDADSGCVGTPSGKKAKVTVSEIALALEPGQDHNGFGVSCAGAADGVLLAAAEGGVGLYTFVWSNGEQGTSIHNLSAGTYAVTVADEAGCRDSLSQMVVEPEPVRFDVDFSSSKCASNPNGTVTLRNLSGGVLPYAYNLQGQTFREVYTLPLVLGGLAAGDYTLQLRDDNGCMSSTPLTIAEDNLRIDFAGELELSIGDSVRLEPEANFDLINFEWRPLDQLSDARSVRPFVRPHRSTAYTLTAVDTSGCRVSASVMVIVDQTRKVYVPSAFTPNEDGYNDRFTIFGGDDLRVIDWLQVYDRWGNLLYEAKELPPGDDHFGWNGEHRGTPMPAGPYFYRSILKYNNGDEQLVEGEVLLLR